VELPVAGVFYDYSTAQGYLIMDWSLYRRHFQADRIDSLPIYLAEGSDTEAVAQRVRTTLAGVGGLPQFNLMHNRQIRAFALDAFNRTFRITYVMEAIAILIAILGVANTLLSQILDRREEIHILHTLGATRRRIARVIVLESGLIGLAGVLLGVAVGLVLAWILARVIMLQTFGWTIQFDVPWLAVALFATAIFASTLLAGLYPAREASRLHGSTSITPGG
jgi:putative ABC transport system permease protein